MKCEICESGSILELEVQHIILGTSDLITCEKCGHRSFRPKKGLKERRKDEVFSEQYAKVQQHNDGILDTFKSRKFFIDYSRFVLLCHFIFLKRKMKTLEIGPGFPGMFQQLKQLDLELELFAIEREEQSRKLLKEYGVDCIAEYFPISLPNRFHGYFDAIIACNVLYYFDEPIKALEKMLELLNENGVILLDILNDELIDDDYIKGSTMSHIFTKQSLKESINKAGGQIDFLNTCCVKDPQKAFDEIDDKKANKLVNKVFAKIQSKLNLTSTTEAMAYYNKASQLKYGDPEGQYIRAIISKK